jgi:MFS family permease
MSEKKILTVFYSINAFFTLSASLVWGINTLFLIEAGLSMYQVFMVNSAFTIGMALFEIPTGVFADTLGRRFSFLSGIVILVIMSLLYIFAFFLPNNVIPLFAVSLLTGLGFTFYSGALEAWLVDELAVVKSRKELDSVFSSNGVITSIAMLFGTILGGVLGTYFIWLPYLFRAILQGGAFLIALLFMKEIGFTPRSLDFSEIPREMKKIATDSIQYGFTKTSIRLIMISTMIFSFFMMWGWYAWQPYFLRLFGNMDAVWLAGIISALVSICMAAGNQSAQYLLKLFKRRSHVMIFSFSIQAAAIIGVGLIQSFYITVPLFLIFIFFLGTVQPVRQSYLHSLIPSDKRATVISFDSLVGSSTSIVGQNSLGKIAQDFSIERSYFISGIINVSIIPVLLLLKKQNEKQDYIKN